MHLNSNVAPVYLPEPEQNSVLRLGLRKLEPEAWLFVDDDFLQFHSNKLQCLERYGEKVCQALPGSEAAQYELKSMVLDHLLNEHSSKYEITEDTIHYLPGNLSWSLVGNSVWQTSLWIQEDICLLENQHDHYVLTAASVCAPSNWALEEKIGRSLDDIHGPVPGYAHRLSQRVNRLFARLKPDRPMYRYNWSVQTSAELFWRNDMDYHNPGKSLHEALYWRVERQSLRRLPATGAIVFTIRIFIHSFQELNKTSGFTENWKKLIAGLPADQRKYKGLFY